MKHFQVGDQSLWETERERSPIRGLIEEPDGGSGEGQSWFNFLEQIPTGSLFSHNGHLLQDAREDIRRDQNSRSVNGSYTSLRLIAKDYL